MKSRTKRLLAMALSLIMIFSCMSMGVFAADEETVRQYGKEGGYLAIGDSVCRGCGSEGYFIPSQDHSHYYDYTQRNVEGAFPYVVAQAVGCSMPADITDQTGNYWPLCYPGMTLGVTMDLLGIDDGFDDLLFDYSNYKYMMKYFGYEGSLEGVGEDYGGVHFTEQAKVGSVIDLIDRSSLITIELGMCDVFYRALRIAEQGGFLADGISLDFSDPQSILQFAKGYLGEMYNGFEYWKTWFPKLLEKIREINPEATVAVVGAFNVVGGVKITDETLLPVGDAIALLTDSMNKYYRQWAKEYDAIYVDITNTETLAGQNGWAFLGDFLPNAELASHPSKEGNVYIGNQIIRALPRQDGPTPATTDIVVDLARYTDVSFVLVNGVITSNYSMDGTVLTIPCKTRLANSLTIAIKGEDGKVALQTYMLKYENGAYTARRVVNSNDIGSIFTHITDLIKSVTKSIFSGIAKLFNKG